MKACKVSIILPVYNTSKYLGECMDSLINQTLDEIEIIAVNDGSTDNSLDILKTYQAQNAGKVYVYNTENHGVSSARNYALEKASGEFIWFVDSDDYVEANACETLYNKAVSDNNDLVLFSRYDVDGQTNEKKGNKTFHFNQNFRACDEKYEMVKLSPFPWNKFIRRDLIGDLRFPEGIRFEDLPVSFILFTRAKNVGVINDFLYNYRMSVGFLSTLGEQSLDIAKAFDFLKRNLDNDGTLSLYKEEIEYLTLRHFLYRFEQVINSNGGDIELKRKIVNTLFDYIDKNCQNPTGNKYFAYNLSDRLFKLLDFYLSRDALLDYIEQSENKSEEEQNLLFASVLEKYQPTKKDTTFVELKEKLAERSLLFATKQRNEDVRDCAVFVSNAKKGVSSSVLAMLLYVKKAYPDMQLVLACRKKSKERAKALLDCYGISDAVVIHRGGENYVNYSSTAKYVIADCPLEHYFKTKTSQKYINLMTEYTLAKEVYRRQGKDYHFAAVQKSIMTADLSVFLNDESRMSFEKKYKLEWLKTHTLSGACPALDNIGIQNIGDKLGVNEKKVVLFIPHYKLGDERTPVSSFRKYMASLVQLDKQMGNDVVGYVYCDKYSRKLYKDIFTHIKKMPENFDLYDFIGAADAVVTNYHPLLTRSRELGAYVIDYCLDENLYISDEVFGLDENTPRCSNPSELLSLITSAGKNEHTSTLECKKVFDALDDGKPSDSKDEQKTVLYFTGGNLTLAKIRDFKRVRSSDPDRKYFLAFDEGKNPDCFNELDEHLSKIDYMPIRFDSNTCFDSKMISQICKKGKAPLFSKSKLEEHRKEAWHKYFGDLRFDEIILYSVGEIERNLMFIGASPELEYSFNWFSIKKYNEKKSFKGKVDYICRELENAQIVRIPDEMKGLRAVDNLNIGD